MSGNIFSVCCSIMQLINLTAMTGKMMTCLWNTLETMLIHQQKTQSRKPVDNNASISDAPPTVSLPSEAVAHQPRESVRTTQPTDAKLSEMKSDSCTLVYMSLIFTIFHDMVMKKDEQINRANYE